MATAVQIPLDKVIGVYTCPICQGEKNDMLKYRTNGSLPVCMRCLERMHLTDLFVEEE